tara:strand:- start:17686 stop:18417 length:732 start_codon:yes stop_codon:yes gene_type:complete
MNKWVIGNWKCNVTAEEASILVTELINIESTCNVGIAPPAVYLGLVANADENLHVGLQNISERGNGAFTGEISVEIANSLNAQFALVGHSERRELFNETDEVVRAKVEACLVGELLPVMCIGESLEVREKKQHLPLLYAQVRSVFEGLKLDSADDIVLAYEPIWAIGTGKIPTLDEIEEVHVYLQNLLEELHPGIGGQIPILYGGSVKPNNAKEIFSVPAVSGALVGGASLDSQSFIQIIEGI